MKTRAILPLLALATLPLQAQRITVSTDVVDCGQILFRKPIKAAFRLSNKGRDGLRIDEVKASCGCTNVTYPKGLIGSGTDFTLEVEYDARQMGHFEKQFFVYSNGSKQPLELRLRGVVVDEIKHFAGEYHYTLGQLRVDSTNIEFDNVNRGERPVTQIHIFNPTSKSLSPVLMHLPPYLTAEISPSTITPGHSGVARLTLDSHKLRDFGLTQTTVYLGAFPGDKVAEDKSIEVSAVLIPQFANMTSEEKASAPRLSMSAESLDLGSFDSKKKKKGDIELTNNGRSTLEITSLQMFTNGLSVSLNKTKIKPGETAKLRVTAEKKVLRQKGRPRVLMITNDPASPKVIIEIKVRK